MTGNGISEDSLSFGSDRAREALAYLEEMITGAMVQMLKEQQKVNRLLLRSTESDGTGEHQTAETSAQIRLDIYDRGKGTEKDIKFPQASSNPYSTRSSALSLARYMRIVEILHETLTEDASITKRDVFYRDVHLFSRQAISDEILDTIVASAGLCRNDFRLSAAAKGLLYCPIAKVFVTGDESVLDCSTAPCHIPEVTVVRTIHFEKQPKWLLIVEKEAVYHTLVTNGFATNLRLGPGILITGKGYPDLKTLRFLRYLADTMPTRVPLFKGYLIIIITLNEMRSQAEDVRLGGCRSSWD